MVHFLSIIFFSWISSIFVGFFKSSRFFLCHSVLLRSSIKRQGGHVAWNYTIRTYWDWKDQYIQNLKFVAVIRSGRLSLGRQPPVNTGEEIQGFPACFLKYVGYFVVYLTTLPVIQATRL